MVFLALLVGLSPRADAQDAGSDIVWVQIEAHPSLNVAQTRARLYGEALPDVNGFAVGRGWYAIALGPYRRDDAGQVLRVYRREGRIPRDSFIAERDVLGRQFWPVGATPPAPQAPAPAVTAQTEPDPEPQITPADETPAEARRSERLLTGTERKALQIALKWAGFYNSGIDGAYGPGTRRAMADWQGANGYETTGILTTAQRAALLAQYNAPLTSVGMAPITDAKAGIAMQIPAGEVAFSRYEAPFAHYDNSTDSGIRVLLISQPGTQATLWGLYDIMQTLEIVPLEGPRKRGRTEFTLEGRNDTFVSYTQASLKGGNIKGFTLIWPTGDEARRTRVLEQMQQSFERLDGVLDAAAGAAEMQDIDLISGLQIRRPTLSRSGVYLDAKGTVLTTDMAVQGCGRVTLDTETEAEVIHTDAALGLAVLRPRSAMAPSEFARFTQTTPRLKSQVLVSGFSFEGVLGAPSLTFGTFEDNRGLNGETTLDRLALSALPGDAGGPVLDQSGAVLGLLLSPKSGDRQLPDGVSFAADAMALRTVLEEIGVTSSAATDGPALPPDALRARAANMTALVSCWE